MKVTTRKKIKKIYVKYKEKIVLGLLCITVLISHLLYVATTQQYPQMDEQHYMDMAVEFYRLLQHPSFDTPLKMIEYIPFRQPGYSLLILPFLLVFGISHSYSIALVVNGFLYVVTIIGIYFLGKEYLSKGASLFAAILFACFGWSLFYLHFTYSETATTAFSILSLVFLQKSKYFTHTKFSVFFGVCFGIGLLIRWVTPIFIIGPLLFVVTQGLRKNLNVRFAWNIIVSLLIIVAISSLPYIINTQAFWGSYVKEQLLGGALWQNLPTDKKSHISFQSAAYYFKIFEQLTIYIFVLFIVGLGLAIKNIRKYLFILSAFFVPYLLFSFATVIKDDRYIVPIYPIVALIGAIVIDTVKHKQVKGTIVGFFMFLSLFNFVGATWGIGPLGKEGLTSVLLSMPVGHPRRIHFTTLVWPPTKEYSNAKQIMSIITRDMQENKLVDPFIIQFYGYQPVDNAIYALNKFHRVTPLRFYSYIGAEYRDKKVVTKHLDETVRKADYLLIKSGKVIDNYFPIHNYVLLDKIQKVPKDKKENVLKYFKRIAIVAIPLDNSNVVIYKRMGQIPQVIMMEFIDAVTNELPEESNESNETKE